MQIYKQLGFALISVIWALLILTAIAAVFSLTLRTEIQLSGNLDDSTSAEYAAQAGKALALARLVATDPSQRWQPSHQQHRLDWHGYQVRIRISTAKGKVDINKASSQTLKLLFEHLASAETNAATLADAVIDWRDSDSSRRSNGAEINEYKSASITTVPANAPFTSLTELAAVKGFNRNLVQQLLPHITIHSPTNKLHLKTSSVESLSAIPGVARNTAFEYFEAVTARNNTSSIEQQLKQQDTEGLIDFGNAQNPISIHINVYSSDILKTSIRVTGNLNLKKRSFDTIDILQVN